MSAQDEFRLDEARAVLARTPAVLRALLEGLPEPWLAATEGDGRWSAFEVIGHLVDGEETDWIPRARMILEHGTGRAFEPFDRFAHQRRAAGETLAGRLDRFEALRRANLAALDALVTGPADLARRGRHPEFGEVTLGQLLATWVAHDLDHLVQVGRTMARRYTAAAGPWTAYLRVLRPQ